MNEKVKKSMLVLYYLSLITAAIESVLAFPFFGGIIVLVMLYLPLMVLLGFYIASLVFSIQTRNEIHNQEIREILEKAKRNYIIGIVLTALAWIPFFGWISHILMTFLMWQLYFKFNEIQDQILQGKVDLVDDIPAADVKSDSDNESDD
ncbi:hypothetical protein [Fructilactobacillus florum]|nr:hypothetical protein [Fructilactobacillus florum]EKK20477.1 hypothetical protein B807_747 [Fructilactobacillus florum 2F]